MFINNGSDYNCLKSLSTQGLVQKDVTVQGKYGTYVRKQWVSPQAVSTVTTPIIPKSELQPKLKTMYISKLDSSHMYSYSDLLSYFGKHKKSSESFQKFVRDNYHISDGKTQTSDFYKSSKGYTKDRKELHKKIIQNILNSANSPSKGQKPVAVLMGGGSASGKGTIGTTLVVPRLQSKGIKVGISDCDDIKEQLPEYSMFKEQDPSTAALRVHEESMDVSMQAVDELIKNNKNLMFDSTMKSPAKMLSMIDKLHKAGYQVQIIGSDVPLNIAFERSNKRADETGRKVPEGIIVGSHGGFSITYPQLINKVDGYSLYDNSGQHPILIQDERGIHRPDLYRNFVQKGKEYQIDKQLQRLSRDYGVPQNELKNLYNHGASIEELAEYLELGLYEED